MNINPAKYKSILLIGRNSFNMGLIFRIENGFFGSFLYIKGDENNSPEEKINITGMVSLAGEYEEKACPHELISDIITELLQSGRKMESRNKNVSGMILNPEYIYINDSEKENHIEIFYYNGNSDLCFDDEILKLAEFLTWHADHKSEKAIALAYGFYNQVIRKNYVFDSLLAKYGR